MKYLSILLTLLILSPACAPDDSTERARDEARAAADKSDGLYRCPADWYGDGVFCDDFCEFHDTDCGEDECTVDPATVLCESGVFDVELCACAPVACDVDPRTVLCESGVFNVEQCACAPLECDIDPTTVLCESGIFDVELCACAPIECDIDPTTVLCESGVFDVELCACAPIAP